MIGQFHYNVPGLENNIDSERLKNGNWLDSNKKIIKLGIQAEPGTKVDIDGNEIIIGRTGIYELDNENIKIEKVKLTPRPNYSLDKKETDNAATNAINGFGEIEVKPYTTNGGQTLEDWVTEFNKQQNNFLQVYPEYLKAKNGVYVEDTNTPDFQNLIIDYIAI